MVSSGGTFMYFGVMVKVAKGKVLLQAGVHRDVLLMIKDMHKAYNASYGANLSFAKFVEGVMVSYIKSDQGKSLLMEAYRESQKQD